MQGLKCAIIGDAAVGKTAITQTFLTEGSKFPKSYNLTFAIEPSTKTMTLETENKKFEYLLFDSSGYDIYADIFGQCWKNTMLVLAVYDVTNEQSLENVSAWVQMIRQINSTNMPCLLFGNKTDLVKRRTVSTEQGKETAQKLGIYKHMEGSAKEYDGISEAFLSLAQQALQK